MLYSPSVLHIKTSRFGFCGSIDVFSLYTGLCSIRRSKWWESETWYFQLLLCSALGLHKDVKVRFLVAVLMSFLWMLISVLLDGQSGGKVRLGTSSYCCVQL